MGMVRSGIHRGDPRAVAAANAVGGLEAEVSDLAAARNARLAEMTTTSAGAARAAESARASAEAEEAALAQARKSFREADLRHESVEIEVRSLRRQIADREGWIARHLAEGEASAVRLADLERRRDAVLAFGSASAAARDGFAAMARAALDALEVVAPGHVLLAEADDGRGGSRHGYAAIDDEAHDEVAARHGVPLRGATHIGRGRT